jgi:hypothetical protein
MILYSIVPDDTVFADIANLAQPEEVSIQGMIMQIERLDGNRARIVRLITPIAEHYLDERYTPGRIIDLQTNLIF